MEQQHSQYMGPNIWEVKAWFIITIASRAPLHVNATVAALKVLGS